MQRRWLKVWLALLCALGRHKSVLRSDVSGYCDCLDCGTSWRETPKFRER